MAPPEWRVAYQHRCPVHAHLTREEVEYVAGALRRGKGLRKTKS